ncbi:21683_t:CDS:2 [Racocetra persica]|uniref:21683_t:CDS:1 n=1 Tax=Racocetra persica TaxID=160502 RepID=A0ACA9MC16_9GLOM|nr:21683_t:CDS:2 [Racocetra persica]
MCSERHAKKRQKANLKKKSKIATDLEVVVPTISTSIFKINKATDFLQIDNILEDHNDLELALETSIFDYESANNRSLLGEFTKFALEVELDSKLLDVIKIDQELETGPLNLEKTKDSFAQLIKILILLLESGSRYY